MLVTHRRDGALQQLRVVNPLKGVPGRDVLTAPACEGNSAGDGERILIARPVGDRGIITHTHHYTEEVRRLCSLPGVQLAHTGLSEDTSLVVSRAGNKLADYGHKACPGIGFGGRRPHPGHTAHDREQPGGVDVNVVSTRWLREPAGQVLGLVGQRGRLGGSQAQEASGGEQVQTPQAEMRSLDQDLARVLIEPELVGRQVLTPLGGLRAGGRARGARDQEDRHPVLSPVLLGDPQCREQGLLLPSA
mgnify:CR=1 FL=1